MLGQDVFATDRTWSGTASSIWNVGGAGGNWSGASVPAGSGDVGVFTSVATTTAVTFNNSPTVGQVRFDAGALAYTFTIPNTRTFTLNNAGIINNSTNTQTFTIQLGGTLTFSTGVSTSSGGVPIANAGTLNFNNTSTANSSTITNTGTIRFINTATAGTSTITNNGGLVDFNDTTTANNATIINNTGNVDIAGTTTTGITIGALSGAGSVVLGSRPLTLGSGAINGLISGTGRLIKTGTGTLTIDTTTPTYTGTTTINGGVLAGLLPTGTALTVNAGGTYDLNGADKTIGSLAGAGSVSLGAFKLTTGNTSSTTFSGVLSDGGSGGTLTKVGTGNFTLSGANTYTGLTTVSAGTLTLASTGSLSSPVSVSGGATFAVSGATLSVSNTLTNSGTTTFSGAATSGGAGITNSGTLNFNNTATASASLISNTGTIRFINTATAGTSTITNNGGLVDFNDTTTANNATIINNAGNVDIAGTTAAGITIGSLSGAGNVLLGSRPLTLGSGNITGLISGTGRLIKTGIGTLTIDTTTPTYTGTTTVDGGTLAGLLPTGTALTVNGVGIYDLNGADRTIGSLAGPGSVSLGAFKLTTGNTTSTTFSGVLSDGGFGGTLTKVGTGNFTLSGANTYTGLTTVSAGALTLASTGSLSGPISVSGGGTFAVSGATLSGANTLTNSGTTAFSGASTSGGAGITNSGTLTFSGTSTASTSAITNNAGAALTFNAGTTAGSSTISNSGTITFATTALGGTSVITNPTGSAGSVVFNTNAATAATAAVDMRIINNTTGTGVTISGTSTSGLSIGSLSGTGNVALGTRPLTLGSLGFTESITGNITGTSSAARLTKVGGGTLTLGGVNTYTGTIINGGTLAVTTNGNLGNVAGGLTFGGGILQALGAFASARGVTLNSGGGTIDTNGNALTLSGIIGGIGSLTKMGTNTLTLSGVNTYSGGTIINGGTLAVTNNGNLGNVAGGLTFGGGILQALGAFTSARGVTLNGGGGTIDTNGNALTLSGIIGGIGSLTKTGINILTLSGNNTYSGGTTITGGTIAVQTNNTALGTGAFTFNGVGTTLRAASGGLTLGNGINLTSAGIVDTNGNALTLSGSIGGMGSLTKIGANTLTLSGVNTYTGLTTVSGGTLTLTGSLSGSVTVDAGSVFNVTDTNLANLLTNNGTTNFTGTATANVTTIDNAGVVDISGTTAPGISIGSLSGAGAVVLGSRTLTLGALNQVDTISGIMSGLGNLIKTGTSTLTLATAPTYQGTTTVNNGTLAGFLPTGTALTVNGPGIYNLNGSSRTIGSLAGTGAGIVNLGAFFLITGGNDSSTSYAGILTGTGGLTKTGGGTFAVSGANNYTGITTINGGTLAGSLPTGTALTVNLGGTYALNGTNRTIGSLTGVGDVSLGAFVLTTGDVTSTSYSGVLSDGGLGGGLTKQGTGTFTLTTAPTYVGPTTVNAGVLAGLLPTTTALTVNGGGTYNLTSNQTIGSLAGSGIVNLSNFILTTGDSTSTTYSGVLSDGGFGGGLRKVGTGTFTIQTTVPTYIGPTTINAGVLVGLLPANTPLTINGGGTYNLTNNQTIGSLTGSGFVQLGGSTLTLGGDNTSTAYSGTFSGTGGLIKTGTGAFTFSGVGGHTGLTAVNGGSFALTGSLSGPVTVNAGPTFNVTNTALTNLLTNNGTTNFTGTATANAATIANGGAVDISGVSGLGLNIGSYSGAGSLALGSKIATLGGLNTSTTIDGLISGLGGIKKIGTGTLTIQTTVPTYAGPTTIDDGILVGFLPATTVLTVNSPGRYDLTADQTAAALIGSGDIHLNAFTLTTGGNNQSTTYSGVISGTGGLTKEGTGTLTLLGNNTYTGPTIVNGGSIAGPLPDNQTLTLALGTEYILTANETIGGLQGLGNVNLGSFTLTTGGNNIPTTFGGVLFGTGGMIKKGSGVFTLAGANTYTGMTTVNSGTLTLTGTLNGPITVDAGAVFNVNATTLANLVTNNGTTNFSGAITADTATILNNGGAEIDISGITGSGISIGALSGAGHVILGSKMLTLGGLNTPSETISGIISGVGGGLTKIGSGTLTITVAPTYTGLTTINAGVLAGLLPTATALTVNGPGQYNLSSHQTVGSLAGTGNVNLGTFILTTGGSNAPTSYSGTLFGSGGLTKTGAGIFTLAGANSYTGMTTVDSGTLTLTGSLSGPVIVDADPGTVFNVTNTALTTSVANNGTTNFTGTATASVATISNAGTVDISGITAPGISIGSLFGAGAVTLGSKTLTLGALNQADTISGIMSGSGNLIKTGSNTLTFATAPTYFGTTTVNNGTLAGFLPTGTALTVVGPGIYDLNGSSRTIGSLTGTGAGTVNLGAFFLTTGGNNSSTSYAGSITGTGGLIKTGTGTFTLLGANNYTGATTINDGVLAGNLPTGTALTVNLGGTYGLNGANRTIGSLTGAGDVSLGAFVLTTGGDNSSTIYSGFLSDGGLGGGLTKAGGGTFTIVTPPTYVGPTTVNAGVLAGHLPTTTALTVNGGGAYNLTSNQTIGSLAGSGVVNLSNFTLTTGNTTSTIYSGTFSGTGGLTKVGTGIFALSGNNAYAGGTTIAGGTIAVQTNNTALGTGLLTFNGVGATLLAGTTGLNLANGIILTSAGTVNTNGQNLILSGLIGGAGGLVKNNAGTLTLLGPNIYTGGTTLGGGALAINNDGNLGAAAGGLTFTGGTLRTLVNGFSSARPILLTTTGAIDTNGVNATLSGSITGAGELTKLGNGNLTLLGNNNYTGGTTISGGSLTGNTTSIQGNVLNNANVIFDQAVAGVFAGSMSGSGSLTKVNGGNVTLIGTNTYTGGTTVSGGTLTVNTTSLPGNVALNSGTLVFNQTFTGTFAGNMSGPGSLLKEGTGILFLTGNLSGLTGPVTIHNGEIEMTTVNVPQNYILGPNGLLDFSPPAGKTITFGGTITGAGRVEMDGAGTVSFPSTYAYSGSTTVNNGIFSLDGSLPNSSLFVMPGGTLVGNGSALSGNIGGLVSPGHSIGRLTFVNNFTMAPTATYKAEIGAGGASDLIAVGTVASLDGTLNVVSVDPRQQLKGQTYIILTADQRINGTFANLTSTNRIKYTIEYLPNAVRIVTGNLQNLRDAFTVSDTSNAALMARYLDSFDDNVPLGTDLDSVLRVLDAYLGNEDVAGLTAALDQLHPSLFKEFGFLSFNHNALINKTLHFQQQHLRDTARFATDSRRLERVDPTRLHAFYKLLGDNSFRALTSRSNFASQDIFAKGAQKPRGIGLNFAMNNQGIENRPSGMPLNQRIKIGNTSMWIQSYGQLNDKGESSHGNVGIKSRTGGVTLGADYQVMNNTFVGLLGGYSTTFFDWKQTRGNGTMNSGYGGVYGSWMDKCGLYVEGQFIAGNDHIKSTRAISFSTINRAARESHNAFQFSTNAEVGYVMPLEAFTLQPFYNATYMAVHERGYQEQGADSLNLQVKSKTSQFYRGELGTMVYRLFMIEDVLMRPSLQLGWIQKRPVGSGRAQMSGGLVNQPQTLTVLGDSRVRNQFSTGVSLLTQFKEGFYIVGNVSGEIGSGEKSGEAVLSIGYQF